jgi:hypothetical protein
MLSSGGLTDADVASAMPIKILESGPAAGVEAARFLGSCIGIDTLVSFDMGGTTAKIGLDRAWCADAFVPTRSRTAAPLQEKAADSSSNRRLSS